GGEESRRHRHGDLATITQRREDLFRLGLGIGHDIHGDAFESRFATAAAIRGHEGGLADTQHGMHDLAAVFRRHHALVGRFLEIVLVHHFGIHRLLVEIDRLFATAFKAQVGLYLHDLSLLVRDEWAGQWWSW